MCDGGGDCGGGDFGGGDGGGDMGFDNNFSGSGDRYGNGHHYDDNYAGRTKHYNNTTNHSGIFFQKYHFLFRLSSLLFLCLFLLEWVLIF